MDNDVLGTDYCIGFSTAITRGVNHITYFRTSVGSHERIGVVELFGRNSGETALITGYLAHVDRTIICEVPFDVEKVSRLLASDHANSPSHYSIAVISEGAIPLGGQVIQSGEPDAYGHRKLGGVGELLSDNIKAITGINTMYQKLAYLMRGPGRLTHGRYKLWLAGFAIDPKRRIWSNGRYPGWSLWSRTGGNGYQRKTTR